MSITEKDSAAQSGSGGFAKHCLPVKSEEDFQDEQAQLMRAGVYELLGNLFAAAPDQKQLSILAGIGDVDPQESAVAMGWELLRKASEKAGPEKVADEFFGLFVGVGRGELVPFGSWYMTGFLMEKPVAELRSDLRGLGIERQEGVSESEDHIAALCDAMAILIRHPDESGFESQKQFFNDHLEPWAGRFFADLQASPNAHFYRAAGFFAESVFEFEKEYFSMPA